MNIYAAVFVIDVVRATIVSFFFFFFCDSVVAYNGALLGGIIKSHSQLDFAVSPSTNRLSCREVTRP